jgi:hypothetical protein
MNRLKTLGLAVAVLGVVLAVSTRARAVEGHFLKLTRPMDVAGVDLRTAVYSLQWQFEGTRATVTFSRKGRVVATVQGESATFERTVPNDTLFVGKHADGTLAVKALGFAGSNKGIVFPLVGDRPRPAEDLPMGNAFGNEPLGNFKRPVPR